MHKYDLNRQTSNSQPSLLGFGLGRMFYLITNSCSLWIDTILTSTCLLTLFRRGLIFLFMSYSLGRCLNWWVSCLTDTWFTYLSSIVPHLSLKYTLILFSHPCNEGFKKWGVKTQFQKEPENIPSCSASNLKNKKAFKLPTC